MLQYISPFSHVMQYMENGLGMTDKIHPATIIANPYISKRVLQ